MESKTRQCWACRRHRLVCDATHPECRKCAARGIDCPGYGIAKPVRWVPPQQARSKIQPQRKPANPSLRQIRDIASRAAVAPSLPASRELTELLEGIQYYNSHICPDLAATGIGGPKSPHFMPPEAISFFPSGTLQSLVSVALCHRLLQTVDRPAEEKTALTAKMHQHAGLAIKALAIFLDKPEKHTSDATLACVITLMMAEIQAAHSSGWRQHVDGAAAVIRLCGGLSHIVFERPHMRHLLRYYAIVDVLGCSTSPRPNLETTRNQLELMNIMSILYGNGLDTCVPCPPDLFVQIVRVNHLRAQLENVTSPSSSDRLSAALDILRRVKAYPVGQWAAEVALCNRTPLSTIERGMSAPGFTGWLAMAKIFQCAIAIYCISSLFPGAGGAGGADSDSDELRADDTGHPATWTALAQARQNCLTILFDQLRNIKDFLQLRKFVLWPLVVAGTQVGSREETTKTFILEELSWISRAVGIAAPLVAKGFLQKRVWSLELEERKWDELFDQAYLFAL
ncbi:fungal-specific transcription factor domain-containing protein [Podospora aff. communis PSN243]|uniref:Fungal-specific transcription factor domain-containing protein n=1 Tax=Podospora aff. communis PSN243 TaxID=3040156 RepID=A0AAV9GIW4_9PEZI|nr:fungal-specific transcription factor domain-containing protein [Podospora aff. communis PSN243]